MLYILVVIENDMIFCDDSYFDIKNIFILKRLYPYFYLGGVFNRLEIQSLLGLH